MLHLLDALALDRRLLVLGLVVFDVVFLLLAWRQGSSRAAGATVPAASVIFFDDGFQLLDLVLELAHLVFGRFACVIGDPIMYSSGPGPDPSTGACSPRGDVNGGVTGAGADVDDCWLAASVAMLSVGSTSCATKLKS